MHLNGPFHIDGIDFTRDALVRHCLKISEEPGLPEWYRKVFSFIHQFLDDTTGPIQQKSSGTTGDPKEFLLRREAMVASAHKTLSFFSLKPGDRVLLCLPVDYIAGKMMVVRALVGGLDLVLTEPSGRPLQGVTGEISFAAMVPLQVHGSLEDRDGSQEDEDDLSILRTLLIGGGELHPALQSKLSEIQSPAVYESFAMTETYSHFALRQVNGPTPESTFRLLKGVEVETDDRDCLVVNIPEVTSRPVVTNDLVEVEAGGKSFRWLGRIDNVIKSGGIKVIPELLEKRINDILGFENLVLSLDDKKLGQKMVLMVEYPDPNPPLDRWTEQLQVQLGSHEIPKQIITITKIPRNASFKPDRLKADEMLLDSI